MCRGVTPLTRGSVLSEGSTGLPAHEAHYPARPDGGGVWDPQETGHALRGLHGPSAGARGTGEGQAEPPHGFKLGQKRGMTVTTIHNLSKSLFGTQMFRLRRILFIDTQPKCRAASQQTENQPKTFRRQEPPHPLPRAAQGPAPRPPCAPPALCGESRPRPGPGAGPAALHGLGVVRPALLPSAAPALQDDAPCRVRVTQPAGPEGGGAAGALRLLHPFGGRFGFSPEGCVEEPVCEGHGGRKLERPWTKAPSTRPPSLPPSPPKNLLVVLLLFFLFYFISWCIFCLFIN